MEGAHGSGLAFLSLSKIYLPGEGKFTAILMLRLHEGGRWPNGYGELGESQG